MAQFVTIRLYGAARAAAGKSEMRIVPKPLNVILEAMAIGNPRLAQVLAQCSFLIDGVAAHDKKMQIPADSVVDVLPPFAGG